MITEQDAWLIIKNFMTKSSHKEAAEDLVNILGGLLQEQKKSEQSSYDEAGQAKEEPVGTEQEAKGKRGACLRRCSKCGREFEGSPKARICPECKKKAQAEANRKYIAKKHRQDRQGKEENKPEDGGAVSSDAQAVAKEMVRLENERLYPTAYFLHQFFQNISGPPVGVGCCC